MSNYKGIDVSVHNGTVDFAKVAKAGYDFVMIRSGYGDITSYPKQIDKKFETNYTNAKAAGLCVGAYHYMYATTAAAAKKEAQGFLSTIKGKTFDFPVALDIEESDQYSLTASTLGKVIEAFIDTVEAAGYYCMLYSYEAFLKKVPSSTRSKYAVWCANTSGTPSIDYKMHQCSFKGSVSGVSGDVDLDKTDTDFASIIKEGGYNGYTKTSSNTSKVLDTEGFEKGDKGVGVYAYKRLLELGGAKLGVSMSLADDGGYGGGTVKATNAVLKKLGYKQNGIAGTGLMKILKEKAE